MTLTTPIPMLDARPASTSRIAFRDMFGLSIMSATTTQAIDHLLSTPWPQRVAFLNAHCANMAARDPIYRAALASADVILPDGIGVELAARMRGEGFVENLNGTDFTPRLLREAARRGLRVFLLGGRVGVAQEAAANLTAHINGLEIVGTRDGYGGMDFNDEVIAHINDSGADIVVVALGVPYQDCWLAENAHRLNARLTIGVGALLDFLAGRVRRAPRWVRRMRAEWVWRLAMEPRRMAKRYLVGNVTFLLRALRDGTGATRSLARTFDICAALGALIALAPLLAATALAIRVESKGPALFRQTRIGKDGKPFAIHKFRSMHLRSEAQRDALLAQSDRDGICFKSRSDPRVTRVGRIIRRFSIDELPQLFDVLRGRMSIVGPRPALPEEVAAYPERARKRLAAKPGLTGIWQVSGRAEIGFDKMVDMDLAYVRSRTPLLDIILMILTFRAIFGGRGAY